MFNIEKKHYSNYSNSHTQVNMVHSFYIVRSFWGIFSHILSIFFYVLRNSKYSHDSFDISFSITVIVSKQKKIRSTCTWIH